MNTKKNFDVAKETAEKKIDTGVELVKKSTNDRLNYIETHPAQSVLFGSVIYFAIKGLFRDIFRKIKKPQTFLLLSHLTLIFLV